MATLAPANPAVYALPRGGVPVAYEVARALGCDMDILVVRKVGVPGQPELAMGAVAEGGVVLRNEEVISLAGVDEESFDRYGEMEEAELQRRLTSYRAVAEAVDPANHTAIIVDDGLATGSTAMAAVEALRERSAREIWVAVPVAPRDTTAHLQQMADHVVVLSQPRYFGAVGAWYRDFTQTSDDEVRSLLADSRLR